MAASGHLGTPHHEDRGPLGSPAEGPSGRLRMAVRATSAGPSRGSRPSFTEGASGRVRVAASGDFGTPHHED
eukprot:6231176-Pyramimonas_sp.AAC.1